MYIAICIHIHYTYMYMHDISIYIYCIYMCINLHIYLYISTSLHQKILSPTEIYLSSYLFRKQQETHGNNTRINKEFFSEYC